ncbi:MAG: hypothetical protein KI786_05740 [Mameliella sp.]|nr:hypothetical protein [Phaeodactylibacter sp.]
MCTINLNSILSPTANLGGTWSYLGFDASSSSGPFTDSPGITIPDLTTTQEIDLELSRSGFFRFRYTIPPASGCTESSATYTIQALNPCTTNVNRIVLTFCSDQGVVDIRDYINNNRLKTNCGDGSFITGGTWQVDNIPGATISGDTVLVDTFILARDATPGFMESFYDYSNLVEFSENGECSDCRLQVDYLAYLEPSELSPKLNLPSTYGEPGCSDSDPREPNTASTPQLVEIGSSNVVRIVRNSPSSPNCNTFAILPEWEPSYGVQIHMHNRIGMPPNIANEIATQCPDCNPSIQGLRRFIGDGPQNFNSGQQIISSGSIAFVFDQVPEGKYAFIVRAGVPSCYFRWQVIYIQVGADCTTMSFGAAYNSSTGQIESTFTGCGSDPDYVWTFPDGTEFTPNTNPENLTPTLYGDYSVDSVCQGCDFQEVAPYCEGYGDGIAIAGGTNSITANFSASNCGASSEPYRWVLTDGSFVNLQITIIPTIVGVYTLESQCDSCISEKPFEWCDAWEVQTSEFNNQSQVNHPVQCENTPTYTWTKPDNSTETGEQITLDQDGVYEVEANCGNCSTTEELLNCQEIFTITVDNVDSGTGVFTMAIDTSTTNADQLRITGLNTNFSQLAPTIVNVTGGVVNVDVDTNVNGTFSVLVEPLYNGQAQGSCTPFGELTDTCDHFTSEVTQIGSIMTVDGLNCDNGDIYNWVIPGGSFVGKTYTAVNDGVHTVNIDCDGCTDSPQAFICQGLDSKSLFVQETGVATFQLTGFAGPGIFDWLVGINLNGNDVGSEVGVNQFTVGLLPYGVVQGNNTVTFTANSRYRDLSFQPQICGSPVIETETFCVCDHNLGFGLTFHDGVNNVLTFILPDYFDDGDTIVVLNINGTSQQYFLSALDSQPAPGGNTRYFFFQFSVGSIYVLSVGYQCCNFSQTRDFTG